MDAVLIKSLELKRLCFQMAAKPLTTEAIALTEKKMNMALDDIIKMSKDNAIKKKPRTFNKNKRMFNGAQDKSAKVRQYMDSRSSLRQGALARRRSNFQGNAFPLASEAARKAIVAPLRNIPRRPTAPWDKRRFGAGMRQQGSTTSFRTIVKPKPLVLQQQQYKSVAKPKTLDSLFASMKEQRMSASARPNFPVGRGRVSNGNQRRQQLGQGRYANNY
ncbi:hypothetical protein AKJ16_DCAP22192 [Drosera capensis]